jgi:hypothetical protein
MGMTMGLLPAVLIIPLPSSTIHIAAGAADIKSKQSNNMLYP